MLVVRMKFFSEKWIHLLEQCVFLGQAALKSLFDSGCLFRCGYFWLSSRFNIKQQSLDVIVRSTNNYRWSIASM